MLRRLTFLLKPQKALYSRTALRAFTTNNKPPQSDPTQQTTDKANKTNTATQPNKEENDQDVYDDYGDVKIRRGGRTIKVDEKEHVGDSSFKKGVNFASAGFRIVWWGAVGYLIYTLYDYKTQQNKKASNVVDEYFLEAAKYIDHSYRKVVDLIVKPPSDKLLPDPPRELYPPGYEEPKTLLINLSGTTIHSNYKMGKGRELIKRPGLDELIKHFARRCELVIFSDDDVYLITTLLPKLDPTGQSFYYALGSESMALEGSKRIKDLKYVNRDLKKVIVLENDPARLKHHSENGIFIPTFEGDPNDTDLYKLLPFLEYLTHPSVKDVREELKKYGNFNPGEKYMQEIEKRKSEISQRRQGGLGGLFRGMKPAPGTPEQAKK